MAKSERKAPDYSHPAYNITSIYTACRDLNPAMKLTTQGSVLTVEEADLLVMLYGVLKLSWDDCDISADGYVTFKNLKRVTVYDPSLFGRRIRRLENLGFVHIRSSREVNPEAHAKSQEVKIIEKGIEEVKPIWQRFVRFSQGLLKDFSASHLKIHREVNVEIGRILRERREPSKYILGF